MEISSATADDCLAIAELALMAGDGIPGYFWAESQRPGQTLAEAGADLAGSETANFSYRNAQLARLDGLVAGMLLAYRLPAAADNKDNIADFPEFVRPMIALEQCVPESYYINMLATYPRFRGLGVGTELMRQVDRMARLCGCSLISIQVFDSNPGALWLYQRLGYEIIDDRSMQESQFVPAGQVLLLTKTVL